MTVQDIDRLAVFNAEQARGIMHREDYIRQMMALQSEFDMLSKKSAELNVPIHLLWNGKGG